jgi:hypothetical protein
MANLADRIVALVKDNPGLTEAELAAKLFPGHDYQQRVNSTCRRLIKGGKVVRQGQGGSTNPFQYYLPSSSSISG